MAATCTVKPLANETEFNSHISSLQPSCLAVIYFHAPWAEPCKSMSTILSTLATTFPDTPATVSFVSVDAEEVAEVSENYDVTQVPLVVLQKDGQVVESVTGIDASKVRNAVEKHAARSTGGNPKPSLPPPQQVTRPEPRAGEDQPQITTNGHESTSAPTALGEETQEELNARLGQIVNAAPVMLFMKGTPSAPQCGFSRQTVAILREKGVRYGFFNILADDSVRQGLKEYSEWPTFPQIYVGGELIGGLDILKEELENDPEFLKEYSVLQRD